MLKQYAKCVSHGLHDMGVEGEIEIYVDVWRSMNKRYQQRFINPFVDLAKAPWSPYTDTPWVLPCLFDYDDQRDTLDKIADHYSKEQIDVVFVADFPNMTLEHYINGTENINVDLILMHGKIDIIFGNGERYPVPANVNVSLPLDETHTVETMGATPSRFMYAYEGRDVKEENKMAERKLLNLTAFDTIVLDWEEEREKLKNMTKYLKEKSQDIWKATNPVVQFTTFVHKFMPNLMLAMVLSEEGFRHYWDQGFSIAMLDGVVRWFGGDEKQVKQVL
jgi:vitamin K-dependent gamma-carboxylase